MSEIKEVDNLVSTVITSYNKGPYLCDAIDSALAQDYPHHEVIIVDDGSKDDTRQVCAAYGDRVRYIFQENQGCPAAKNTGIRAARGEFVAILDGDDRWRPGKLTKQVELLRRRPDVALVYTDRIKFVGDQITRASNWLVHTPHRGWVLDQLLQDNFISVSSVLARRQALFGAGLFNPAQRIASDYDLWLRFALKYQVDYVDEILMEYRLGIDSIGSREGSKFQHVMNIQNRFVQEHFHGKYPRQDIFRRAAANKIAAHGDAQLALGRQWAAFRAHASAWRQDPANPRRAMAMLRCLVPNSLAAALTRRKRKNPVVS